MMTPLRISKFGKGIWLAAVLPIGLAASSSWAGSGDHQSHQREGSRITSQTATQFTTQLDKDDATIKDAIAKAERKCNGTAISAKCKMVNPRQYAQQLQDVSRDKFDSDQEKMIIEVCCFKKDNPSTIQKVAVCPESDTVALVKDSYVSSNHMRTYGHGEKAGVHPEHIEKADKAYDGRLDRDERIASGRTTTNSDMSDRDYTRREWTRFTSPATSISKANKVIGATVKSPQGEELGEIEDLAIDPESGRVSYAVLSFGGFLGVGDKYFAIPWSSLSQDMQDKDVYTLAVPKERLEKAPGFNKDNWPNMADRQWGEQIHAYYGERPYWNNTYDPFSVEGYEDGVWSMTIYTFADTKQDEADNRQPEGRTVASVIDRKGFDLEQCVEKANSYTNGEAVSAEFVMVPAGRFDDSSKGNQKNESGQYRSSTGSDQRLVANVACMTKKGSPQLKLVSICPESKEVLRVKDLDSLRASADSGSTSRIASSNN